MEMPSNESPGASGRSPPTGANERPSFRPPRGAGGLGPPSASGRSRRPPTDDGDGREEESRAHRAGHRGDPAARTVKKTDKPLLLAAIDAIASIRPREAVQMLDNLADSHDEDIAAAAEEAMARPESPSGEDDDDDDRPY